MLYFHFHLVQYIFSKSPLSPMIKKCVWFPSVSKYITFLLLISSLIGVREYTLISVLLNLLRFTLWPKYRLSWYMFCGHLKRMFIPLCLVNVYYILIADGVEFFCILADFLCSSINCWDAAVELSNYNCGFVNLSLQFCQFLLYTFCTSVVR